MEKKIPAFGENNGNLYIRNPETKLKIKPRQSMTYFDNFTAVNNIYESEIDITEVKLVREVKTGMKRVQKTIYKDQLLSKGQIRQAKMEFQIQASLNHQNIVKCYEYAEDEETYRGLLEVVNNPNYLTEMIDESLQFIESELQMKSFAYDIFEGLRYLHSNGIIHADLKLENILAHNESGLKTPTLKICDFGLSQLEDADGRCYITEKFGTMHYMAPEIKKNVFISNKIDMWSFGIILYKMACAYRPDQIDNSFRYGRGELVFREVDWKTRSEELKDLIKKMLVYNPDDRISVSEAIEHAWFHTDN